MVAQVKPTKKNSPAVKVGNLKNTLPAEKYAMPHDMSGNPVPGGLPAMSTETGVEFINKSNIAVGNVSKTGRATVKTDGVKQRGYGAATKGFTSRGPMA
jgi:hypothetical protein